jgi:hypothetical protein
MIKSQQNKKCPQNQTKPNQSKPETKPIIKQNQNQTKGQGNKQLKAKLHMRDVYILDRSSLQVGRSATSSQVTIIFIELSVALRLNRLVSSRREEKKRSRSLPFFHDFFLAFLSFQIECRKFLSSAQSGPHQTDPGPR